ncbi:MAG: hypothetical protein AAGU32_21635, partial [Bacillota bacterium]
HVTWLFLRIMKREYRIGRDNNRAVVLYRQLKNQEQIVTTLTEILFKEKPDRDASLLALIKLAIQSRYERRQASPWLTVLERSRVVLRLYVGLGVGDAFATAMVCGLLIAVGNAVCAANSTKRESYRLSVKPIFNGTTFSLEGDCIIDITPANIILGYFIYKLKARGKKHASD